MFSFNVFDDCALISSMHDDLFPQSSVKKRKQVTDNLNIFSFREYGSCWMVFWRYTSIVKVFWVCLFIEPVTMRVFKRRNVVMTLIFWCYSCCHALHEKHYLPQCLGPIHTQCWAHQWSLSELAWWFLSMNSASNIFLLMGGAERQPPLKELVLL